MNIGGIGQNFYQNPMMQGNMLRQMIENSGSENLKKMAQEGASDEQLLKYAMENPAELQGNSGTPWADSALGTGTANEAGTTSTAQQTGNADAAGAAAAGSDQLDISSDSGDCYDEDDEIPTDEAMATSGMCGMDDVSGADRCKPYTQQCLGETKAIKKVLEQIKKADSDNSSIDGDIQEVDGIIKDFSSKLKKGKLAADGAFSNPDSPEACQKECDDLVKKAVDVASNNGVEIEVSEKKAQSLGVGGGQQGAGGAEQSGTGKQANQPKQANQATQANQAKQGEQTQDKPGAKALEQAENAEGQQEEQKPFKITSEPKEVDKDLSLDEVSNNPQLAQALESSLDETIAQLDAQGQTGEGTAPQQAVDLGATREGSPLAQSLDGTGKQQGDASVFGGQQAASGIPQGGGFAAGMPGGKGGGMQAAGGIGGSSSKVNTSGIESKMKRAGIDTGKKFKVKAQVYEPGMDVKVQRDGDTSPVKVGKNMDGATMKVKPPPLAAIDQNGEMHKLGDIKATDGGKSGIFSAKVKEGQPVMNLQAAVNTVQGDVALPGTKTEAA